MFGKPENRPQKKTQKFRYSAAQMSFVPRKNSEIKIESPKEVRNGTVSLSDLGSLLESGFEFNVAADMDDSSGPLGTLAHAMVAEIDVLRVYSRTREEEILAIENDPRLADVLEKRDGLLSLFFRKSKETSCGFAESVIGLADNLGTLPRGEGYYFEQIVIIPEVWRTPRFAVDLFLRLDVVNEHFAGNFKRRGNKFGEKRTRLELATLDLAQQIYMNGKIDYVEAFNGEQMVLAKAYVGNFPFSEMRVRDPHRGRLIYPSEISGPEESFNDGGEKFKQFISSKTSGILKFTS